MKVRYFSVVMLALILVVGVSVSMAGPKSHSKAAMDSGWLKKNKKITTLVQDKKYDQARKLSEQAYEYLKKKGLEESLEAATTLNNLGMIEYLSGPARYPYAMAYLNKALSLRTRLLGKNSPDVGTVWKNLSEVYLAEAKLCYAQYQRIQEKSDKGGKKAKDQNQKLSLKYQTIKSST